VWFNYLDRVPIRRENVGLRGLIKKGRGSRRGESLLLNIQQEAIRKLIPSTINIPGQMKSPSAPSVVDSSC
jgi:hypothetical protein